MRCANQLNQARGQTGLVGHAWTCRTESINRSIVQGSAIGSNSFSICVEDLKALGNTNLLCKYADDTTLLVAEVCDVKIENELVYIIRCSTANKLQLNLGKSKEIVFICSNVHLNILPVQLVSTERMQCCLLYTSPSPRDRQKSRMPSSA